MLLDEVLYMEIRVFREFIRRHKLETVEAYRIFDENDIWGYITYERRRMRFRRHTENIEQEDQFCFLTDKAVNCLEFVEARKYVI